MVDWSDLTAGQLVLLGLVVAVAGTMLFTIVTSSSAYNTYNSDWDGTSRLRSLASGAGLDVTVARDSAEYERVPADDTVALVLAPNSAYEPSEMVAISEFIRNGGTLVVAGDYGSNTNRLLNGVGASARLNGSLLRDTRSNYRSSALPVAPDVANHSLVAGVDSLTLNYGTAVEPRGATPLVNTTEFGYLDADRNGRLGVNESIGTYPVVTVERIGEGRVIVVSDPSVFLNAMLDRPGNRRFVCALLSERDYLLLDYTHASSLPPLVLAVLVVRDSTTLQVGLGFLTVAVVAVWSRRPDLTVSVDVLSRFVAGRRNVRIDDVQVSPDEMAAYLERRHPDWERERIERLVSTIERRRGR